MVRVRRSNGDEGTLSGAVKGGWLVCDIGSGAVFIAREDSNAEAEAEACGPTRATGSGVLGRIEAWSDDGFWLMINTSASGTAREEVELDAEAEVSGDARAAPVVDDC